ncbi:MAG: hypothetical protein KDD61_09875 [Bdellovibrionales bacterium]|nr:hypothetical protein [Bdellovibrionales bacterium]
MLEVLFGNRVAEKCLLYIANYGEGYINGIAKTFEISPSQVQKQLERLEAGNILISHFSGNTKLFLINPRLAYKTELRELLESELNRLPKEEIMKYFRQRQRPRKTGKST